MKDSPFVSIIVPNTDSKQIHTIVEALKGQTAGLPSAEILVVGTDRWGLINEDGAVRFVRTNSSACASDKRNLGMRKARGDIFVFLDDDCHPQPNWLDRHLLHHEQGEQVVGGAVSFGQRNYFQLADNVSAFHDLLTFMPSGPRPYLATANLSVSRQAAERAGPMESGKNRAEDLEWTQRFRELDYRLYFDPGAIIWHAPARCSLSAVLKHWTDDAPDTLRVRLRYADLLGTPRLASHRWAYAWGSPAIAAWATVRTMGHRRIFREYWHTLPVVYVTKLAWCWAAFWRFPKT